MRPWGALVVVLASVAGCSSTTPSVDVPCTLDAQQITAARANIDVYLKHEYGSRSVYYEGTTSDVAVDVGTRCRFHVLTKTGPDGSALLDADIFVYVSKRTLLPVKKEEVKW